ncbi:DUF535 domain-containing protein [Pseudomonas sp. Leaf58]|uniref:DUF535 family protein n=1 Tax=Pseudomonas TaxID=286 RepID=UPI0006FD1BCF|nr:DUF535 family protein [Pseudomonas sp. Leaf58]AYG45650.1 DUF535 domain-containing protein [Pseudomonas sp. Leaf58]KQN58857.1 VirK protein [Pseudomonas sp. Leaf58]
MIYRAIVKSVFVLHPGYSLRALRNKLRLGLLIVRHWPGLKGYLQRLRTTLGPEGFQRLGEDCIGLAQWPYISKSWAAQTRFDALASHYEVVAECCQPLLLLGRDDSLPLADLTQYSPNCTLVLDRAFWFMREGELVLNLFQGELRVASLAFTLSRSEEGLCMFIGAVQGIHKGVDSETSLNIYRVLTKDFEGLRPRSLLIEVLRHIAHGLGVTKLYAIGDGYRHHRHPYFGKDKSQELLANYDVIWQEHGATASERKDFFSIPLVVARPPLDQIAAKKRAMYRRRYELLDSLFAQMDSVVRHQVVTRGRGGLESLGGACSENTA